MFSLAYAMNYLSWPDNTTQNITIEMIITPNKLIREEPHIHQLTIKTYKIITGRIYVIKSDSDYPYELNRQNIRSTYASTFDQHTDQ